MLRNVYGLRVLQTRRGKRATFMLVVGVVLVYRLISFSYTQEGYLGYDFSAYWAAAGHLLHGESIYSPGQLAGPYAPQQQFLYVYPPVLAAAVVPLAALFPTDYRQAAAVWSLIGVAVAVSAMLALVRSEGLAERFPVLAGKRRWLIPLAAFLLPPVLGEVMVGNAHLMLVGLFALAWIHIRRGTAGGDRVAGIAIGLATIIKIFPGLLFIWFLFIGRPRAIAWGVLAALVAALASLPITGIQPWLDMPAVLFNMVGPTNDADAMGPTLWLAPVLGFSAARIIVTTLGVGIVLWSSRRQQLAISFATTVLVSVLIAPIMWHHYLAIALVPMLIGLGAGVSPRWIAASYLFLSAGQPIGFGDYSWIVRRGFPTAGALTLLIGLLRVRRTTVQAHVVSAGDEVVTAPASA